MSRDGSPACSRRLGSAFLARPHLPRPKAPPRTGARGPDFGLPLAACAGKGVLSESAAPGLSACIRLLTIAGIYRLAKQPNRAYRLYANNRTDTFKDDQRPVWLENCCNMCNAEDVTALRMRAAPFLRTKHVALVITVQIGTACHMRACLLQGRLMRMHHKGYKVNFIPLDASLGGEFQLHPWLLLCKQQKLVMRIITSSSGSSYMLALCCILATRVPA